MRITLSELVLESFESNLNVDFPAHKQIFELRRQAILSRQLQGASKLPFSRNLASEIGCSRNTIIAAYEQLLAEDYVEHVLAVARWWLTPYLAIYLLFNQS